MAISFHPYHCNRCHRINREMVRPTKSDLLDIASLSNELNEVNIHYSIVLICESVIYRYYRSGSDLVYNLRCEHLTRFTAETIITVKNH